jgi:hypothetical protein
MASTITMTTPLRRLHSGSAVSITNAQAVTFQTAEAGLPIKHAPLLRQMVASYLSDAGYLTPSDAEVTSAISEALNDLKGMVVGGEVYNPPQ